MDEAEQMRELGFVMSAIKGPGGRPVWFADLGRAWVYVAATSGTYVASTLAHAQDGFPTALAAATYYRLQHPAPSLR